MSYEDEPISKIRCTRKRSYNAVEYSYKKSNSEDGPRLDISSLEKGGMKRRCSDIMIVMRRARSATLSHIHSCPTMNGRSLRDVKNGCDKLVKMRMLDRELDNGEWRYTLTKDYRFFREWMKAQGLG